MREPDRSEILRRLKALDENLPAWHKRVKAPVVTHGEVKRPMIFLIDRWKKAAVAA